jgi:hypothetical protein
LQRLQLRPPTSGVGGRKGGNWRPPALHCLAFFWGGWFLAGWGRCHRCSVAARWVSPPFPPHAGWTCTHTSRSLVCQ